MTAILAVSSQSVAFSQQPNTLPDGYRVETIETPEDVQFGVAGLCVAPNGDVYAGTRFGDVWIYRNSSWTLFADGLHEIAGLMFDEKTGDVLAAQKPELTRLIDEDGDGQADLFKTVTDDWGFSGNYHEFSFGPVRDSEGNLYGTLNLSHGVGVQVGGSVMSIGEKLRGTCYKVSPDGHYETFAWGLRSPAGIAINPKTNEIFYTDNQGDFNASSSLQHIEQGGFHGHPCSLLYHPAFKDRDIQNISTSELERMRTPPAVWIPHGEIANSPGNPVFDTTEGKFGPFAGQMFVGDQTRSNVFRVILDKVDGAYQGAVINFIDHLQCGAVRLKFAPDGSMWVGQTSRGWGSVGSAPYGVQRIVYDESKPPFEIQMVHLLKDGFELSFTKPVQWKEDSNAQKCDIEFWNYLYHSAYGSPKVDQTKVEATAMQWNEEGTTLKVKMPTLETGKIYKLVFADLKATDGSKLTNRIVYYTLNRKVK